MNTSPGFELALTGGTVIADPSAEPLVRATVLIADGKIAAIGPSDSLPVASGVETIDCSGLTITSGFWNCHVHFFERKWANATEIPASELERQLQEMSTRFGFTNVFDLSSPWVNTRAIRDRVESGEVRGPRIRSTGLGLLPVNAGLPPEAVLNFMGLMKLPSPEIADAAAAAQAARELLESGVDAVKLFVSTPSKSAMTAETIKGAVDEARRFGKHVFVHPNKDADIHAALEGGVDMIAHTTPRSGPWTQELIGEMRQRGVALTPTLNLWKHFLRHDRASTQDQVVQTAVGQLRAWVAAQGEVLFGTDLGAVEYDPNDEYRLMSAAGMSFRQILESLTTAPAARFEANGKTGRIDVGQDADLTAFGGDAERNIAALADVRLTLRTGRVVYRVDA